VKGVTIPRAPDHYGGAENPNNFTSTFGNAANFLPKDLRFEHVGAKFASCPGRRLQPRYAHDEGTVGKKSPLEKNF